MDERHLRLSYRSSDAVHSRSEKECVEVVVLKVIPVRIEREREREREKKIIYPSEIGNEDNIWDVWPVKRAMIGR